ncbi:MAG: FtsX-like permease family protein [Tomitella sp.]|nr:FtsX-like permease family protein [Tomitella sp.]
MITLVWPSVRHRLPSFITTFVAVFCSALVVGSFATLVETATGPVSGADRQTLVIMGAVIGGWGALIALFSLVSTLSVAVRRRYVEIGLLRTIGATPRQTRRLVRAETVLVAVVAALAGAGLAWPAGRALLDMLKGGGLVDDSVEFAGGFAAGGATVGLVVFTSVVAASIAGRRASRGPARLALAEEAGTPESSRWRIMAGLFLLACAGGSAAVTVFGTADDADPYAAMQTSGSASIVAGVGLAALAPWLLRAGTNLARPLLDHSGVAGHLAAINTDRRTHLLGGVLGPIIVFIAATTGTLMLVGIDSRTLVLPPNMTAADADMLTLLNTVVVGMIALFAALMILNSLLAVMGDRKTEFTRIRLVGGTSGQVQNVVLVETVLVSVVGVALGLVASLATIVPFALARKEGPVPDGQLWLPLAVSAFAVALTVVSGWVAVHQANRVGSALDVAAAT